MKKTKTKQSEKIRLYRSKRFGSLYMQTPDGHIELEPFFEMDAWIVSSFTYTTERLDVAYPADFEFVGEI
jgi:hypothetical protein